MLPGPSLPCSLECDRLQHGVGLVVSNLFWGTDIQLVVKSVRYCIVLGVTRPVAKQCLLFRNAPHTVVAAAVILNELDVCTACDVINGQQV